MTFAARSPDPHNRLFATVCVTSGLTRFAARSSGKKRTVLPARTAVTVPACSNASVLGYRSNNRQRET